MKDKLKNYLEKNKESAIDLISREPLDEKETVLIGDITVEKTIQNLIRQIIKQYIPLCLLFLKYFGHWIPICINHP